MKKASVPNCMQEKVFGLQTINNYPERSILRIMQHKKRPKVDLDKDSKLISLRIKALAINISYKISANADQKNDSEDEVSKNYHTLF